MKSEGSYSYSEVKNILKLSKKDFSDYIYKFSDYFPETVVSLRMQDREYSIDDIFTLSYINYYWEADPDIESIKIGLNKNEHLEYPFSNVYYELTPIIREDFDNILPDSSNYIFFNKAIYYDNFELAQEYIYAAKLLLSDATNSDKPYKKIFPILFNLRHGVELYLKALISKPKFNIHNLEKIYTRLKFETNLDFGRQFSNLIQILDQYDTKGTSFRYREHNTPYEEKFLDVKLTLELIDHFEKVIEAARKWKGLNNDVIL